MPAETVSLGALPEYMQALIEDLAAALLTLRRVPKW